MRPSRRPYTARCNTLANRQIAIRLFAPRPGRGASLCRDANDAPQRGGPGHSRKESAQQTPCRAQSRTFRAIMCARASAHVCKSERDRSRAGALLSNPHAGARKLMTFRLFSTISLRRSGLHSDFSRVFRGFAHRVPADACASAREATRHICRAHRLEIPPRFSPCENLPPRAVQRHSPVLEDAVLAIMLDHADTSQKVGVET